MDTEYAQNIISKSNGFNNSSYQSLSSQNEVYSYENKNCHSQKIPSFKAS